MCEDMSAKNGIQYVIVATGERITTILVLTVTNRFHFLLEEKWQVGKISICCCVPPIPRHRISYNTRFLRGTHTGASNGSKMEDDCEKRECEGGFCLLISHGGYRKQPDAAHQSEGQRLECPISLMKRSKAGGWEVSGA